MSSQELSPYLAARLERMPARVRAYLPQPEPEKPSSDWKIPVAWPYISPEATNSVQKAISASTISSATRPVQQFEEELKVYFQVPTAKACSNGYAALVLCLKLAEIGPGHEVLVPSLTMVAVLNAVLSVGAKPVIVDVQAETYNPSPEQYLQAVTSATKGVIVTHTYGIPVDLDGIGEVCDRHNLVLLEDVAESIGTTYKGRPTGAKGDFAAASLYANKLITAGDGGFVLSKHTHWKTVHLQERLDSLANHGFVPKFHFMHFEQSGNYKMSGLAAALISPAVKDIPMLLENRSKLATWYRQYLSGVSGIKLMPESPYGPDAPWVFCVEVLDTRQRRYDIRCQMAKAGIETRDFFLPLHLQPVFHSSVYSLEETVLDPPSLPNSERLGNVGFYLPTHYHLEQTDVLFICNTLRAAVGASAYQAGNC